MTKEELLKVIEAAKVKKAKSLSLLERQLSILPDELFQLPKLESLFLRGNHLTTLPSNIGKLTKLKYLDLNWNQLTSLPTEICELSSLKHFSFEGNPLTSPPLEIARKGIDAICQYFSILQAGETPVNQIKVLLVSDGAAGKTSLLKRLLGEAFNQHEDTTHGISIRGWDVKASGQPIKVNIWDFGGQEIMHATHQFFLFNRSLYVLVLDGRKNERAEYWGISRPLAWTRRCRFL